MIKDRSVFSTQKDIIKTARRNKNLLNSIVAEDENWCFRHDPTTKLQNAEWKSLSITKGQKYSSSKAKSEENSCVFLRQQGNYTPRVCSWGTNCHWKFLFECSGTHMEEVSPCPARILSTRQLVSSSRQCTGSPLHDNAPLHLFTKMHRFTSSR